MEAARQRAVGMKTSGSFSAAAAAVGLAASSRCSESSRVRREAEWWAKLFVVEKPEAGSRRLRSRRERSREVDGRRGSGSGRSRVGFGGGAGIEAAVVDGGEGGVVPGDVLLDEEGHDAEDGFAWVSSMAGGSDQLWAELSVEGVAASGSRPGRGLFAWPAAMRHCG